MRVDDKCRFVFFNRVTHCGPEKYENWCLLGCFYSFITIKRQKKLHQLIYISKFDALYIFLCYFLFLYLMDIGILRRLISEILIPFRTLNSRRIIKHQNFIGCVTKIHINVLNVRHKHVKWVVISTFERCPVLFE